MGGKVLVFEPDLMFSSRIESIAANAGLEVKVTSSLDELERAVQESAAKALIVNLDVFPNVSSLFLDSVRGRCRLLGYYSHVDSKLAAHALAIGFEEVMPRRTFVDKLKGLLTDLALA